MGKAFENKAEIGIGIYTMPDISRILRIPNYKVNRWVRVYFDSRFGKKFGEKYSWVIDGSKAVSFHTLIELYTFYHLNDLGVKTKTALKAHEILSDMFDTKFPFANKKVMSGLRTDKKKIYFEKEENVIISLDGSNQLSFNFLKIFLNKLDFGNDMLANKLWPIGKSKSVLCDPQRQLGRPVIGNTNVYPESIYNLYLAEEPKKFIAKVYELSYKQVNDAIEYCKPAA